jgi:hypothetical protein
MNRRQPRVRDPAAMNNDIRELNIDELDAVSGGGGGIPPGADVEQLAFVVLMNATNDQQNDLQEIMNAVQAQTKAKSFFRRG